MKRLFLIALSLALCIYGWSQIRDYAWMPADAPRWNPFAIKESGFGRTLARALTEQANASYHHGLLERKPPMSTNPLSHWLDAGSAALGFQGSVRVSCEMENERECELRFRVSDTGTGIAPGTEKKLFEAFSQGDTSTTRKFGGKI